MFVILLSFTNCKQDEEPIGKYRGYIVMDKNIFRFVGDEYRLCIESDTSTLKIYVFKGTYNKYQIGDTIK